MLDKVETLIRNRTFWLLVSSVFALTSAVILVLAIGKGDRNVATVSVFRTALWVAVFHYWWTRIREPRRSGKEL